MRTAEPGRDAPGIRRAERCFAVLLRAYPRRFRRRFGDEACRLFADRYREEYQAAGWLGIARYGLRTLGNVAFNSVLERVAARDRRRGDGRLRRIATDIRHALRGLRRSPGFTVAAVLALALGIGGNAAIFSLINGVVLQDLPYGDTDTLMLVASDPSAATGAARGGVSPADLIDWRTADSAFVALTAHRNSSLGFTALERPLVPLVNEVTANYFDVLQVEPFLGRTFRPGEDVVGERFVILSHRLWQSALGADPQIVGRTIELDDEPWTVIGVLQPDFHATNIIAVQPDLWVPLVLDPEDRAGRTLLAFGRLRSGVSAQQAQDELRAVAARLAREYPDTNEGWSALVMPIRERVLGTVQQVFLVLLAAVGFVLLIACANVANLILARSTERAQELSLRLALGAGHGRLIQQLVTETVVLALLAGALAVAVAIVGLDALVALIPPATGMPFLERVQVDGTVLGFSLALSVITGLVCALVPAAQLGRADLSAAIRSGGRAHTGSAGGRRLRDALVVSEFALSLVLLFGAALMLQTFVGLRGYEPGFDVDRLLHLRTSLRGKYRAGPDSLRTYFAELTRRLEAVPGVEAVSGVSAAPPVNTFLATGFEIPGRLEESGAELVAADRRVLPGYFEALGIPLLHGRSFDDRDGAGGAPVAIVNEAFARRHFPGEELDAMRVVIEAGIERRVVGVVGNVRAAGADPHPLPVLYTPFDQRPIPIMTLMVRTAGDPALLARAAGETAWGMGPDMNVYEVEPMSDRLDVDAWRQRFISQLTGAFALLAVTLGAAGIYSVLTFAVAQRTREIGVRVVLGAGRARVIGMIVTHGLRLAMLGAALGLAGALALGRAVESLLFDVSPADPLTLGLVTVALLGVAVVACLVPAVRATRVEAMEALRGA